MADSAGIDVMEEIQIKTEPIDLDYEVHVPLLPDWYPDFQSSREKLSEYKPITMVASRGLDADPQVEDPSRQNEPEGQGHFESVTRVNSHDPNEDPKFDNSACQNQCHTEPVTTVSTRELNEDLEFGELNTQKIKKDPGHFEPIPMVAAHLVDSEYVAESLGQSTEMCHGHIVQDLQNPEYPTDCELNLPCKQEQTDHNDEKPFPVAVYKIDDKSKLLVELPDVGPSSSTDLESFSGSIYSSEAQMEIKVYQCPTCSNILVSKHALQDHLKIHSGIKPFKCSLCDFRCIQKGNFNRHLQIHSGEKPYKCPLCDYSCVNKTRLDKHMVKHSDVKPFKCPLCESRFKRRDQIKAHMKTHYKNDMYNCSLCEYKDSSVDGLVIHMVSHSEENMWTGHAQS